MSGYRAAEQVRWAVEAGGIVVIDHKGEATTLGYPQAAIWDLLTRGESEERACAKLCAIASLDREAAQALMLDTVSTLREAGLLTQRGSDG